MKVLLRKAIFSDLPAILRIAASMPDLPNWPAATYEKMLQQQSVAAVARTCLIGEIGVQIVALGVIATLCGVTPAESEIEAIAVDAGWRRKGIGGLLLEALLAEAHSHGPGPVRLEVRCANVAAIALYRRAGFQEKGRRPDYYHHPTEDALLMEA